MTDKTDKSKPRGLLGNVSSRLKTGRVGRALELSKLAAGSGSKWLAGAAKNAIGRKEEPSSEHMVEIAHEMLKTFANMRGVAMKLGQMLSYMDDFMPPEARRILATLQRDASPMPYEDIRKQFIDSMGTSPEELFEWFSPEPMAAASIGQVHKARLKDGTEVAVKIQYPGIAKAMEADMKNAKFFSLFQQMLFVRTDAKAIMKEIEERLIDECNYEKEAAYQQLFRKRFENHPVIYVPQVFPEYSGKAVLTTELQHGITFQEWLETDPSPEVRKRAAMSFYRFYLGSFYMDGLFNCDPHPGNYLFREDGKIVFLDYGCTRYFPESRRQVWSDMCMAVAHNREEEIHRLAYECKFFKPGVEYNRDAFRDLMRYLYVPYLEDEEYDFRRQRPQQTFREMFTDNPNLFKLNMPADAVFLNRIGFGLVSLQTEIGATINCYRYASSYFRGVDPDWKEDPWQGISFLSEIPAELLASSSE